MMLHEYHVATMVKIAAPGALCCSQISTDAGLHGEQCTGGTTRASATPRLTEVGELGENYQMV